MNRLRLFPQVGSRLRQAMNRLEERTSQPWDQLTETAKTATGKEVWHDGRVYDSGWFAVAKAQHYGLTHGLGSVPRLVQVWFSASVDGSNPETCQHMYYYASGANPKGIQVRLVTATSLQVQVGSQDVHVGFDAAGNQVFYASGYARVIALK